MRALGVVVLDVDAEYPFEVAAVEDQQPVEAPHRWPAYDGGQVLIYARRRRYGQCYRGNERTMISRDGARSRTAKNGTWPLLQAYGSLTPIS